MLITHPCTEARRSGQQGLKWPHLTEIKKKKKLFFDILTFFAKGARTMPNDGHTSGLEDVAYLIHASLVLSAFRRNTRKNKNFIIFFSFTLLVFHSDDHDVIIKIDQFVWRVVLGAAQRNTHVK